MSSNELPQPVYLEGIPVHPLTRDQLILQIADVPSVDRSRRVYNVNVRAMNLAHSNSEFRQALLRADAIYCDGAGVQLALRILRQRVPERLTVMAWLEDALSSLAINDRSLYLIGDKKAVIEEAVSRMRNRHPRLQILGFRDGFFDTRGGENQALINDLISANPDVVLVGLGMPKQELWIEANIAAIPPATFVPVGAAFQWYAEARKRPPSWMQENGLEWLGRLLQEPKRLWRRYLIGIPMFLFRVAKSKLAPE